jgi:hypothetical protein
VDDRAGVFPQRPLPEAYLVLMTDISEIVAPLALQADEQAKWSPVLRVRTYLTTTLPPLGLVSSVRALVQQDDQILIVHDPVSVHILPGGRREPGETRRRMDIVVSEPHAEGAKRWRLGRVAAIHWRP